MTPVIFGLAGLELSPDERRLFEQSQPLGFILFARNCSEPAQIRALCRDLREVLGRPDAPILIDQEGGRVARLKPPYWTELPPAAFIGQTYQKDEELALRLVSAVGAVMALELRDIGVNVNCAPVADLLSPDAHDRAIGDRAYGGDVARVSALANALGSSLMDHGVVPVLKHIPGHGRARSDSHFDLPHVGASREDLEKTDFAVFRACARFPAAMTGHIVFEAYDPVHPATTSRTMIEEVIRQGIGFEGFLMSDDLCMNALSGSMRERALASLGAGCDAVLHCSGDYAEMSELAEALEEGATVVIDRWYECVGSYPPSPVEQGDLEAARALLAELIAAGKANAGV